MAEQMIELTEGEREILTGPIWGVHVSSVYHRPEFYSLMKKVLLTYENQSRWVYKPSFFLVLTPAGKALREEINGNRVEAGDSPGHLP